MADTTKDLLEAASRLKRVFHEDEPSPLMQPEEDNQIREDCLLLVSAIEGWLGDSSCGD